MENIKFKVLMHGQEYIDASRLSNGLYAAATPRLFESDATLESIINTIRPALVLFQFDDDFLERYTENLNKCRLVEIELKEINPKVI